MTPVAAPPSSSFIKMEDRKRSAGHGVDEIAPPTKRQAVNGTAKPSADTDINFGDQKLEIVQKDAIYRQMLEYKRHKTSLESQLRDIQKKSVDHDDHLRVVDSWWSQLLDEVRLLAEDELPQEGDTEAVISSSLSFKSNEDLASHLTVKSKEIKQKLQGIFSSIASSRSKPPADARDLQTKLSALLATQKDYMLKVERLRSEKEELSERLETASLRYIKAERRLDRSKSTVIAKLDAQAIAGASNGASGGVTETGVDTEMVNGIAEENAASQVAYKEATAVLEKQKEQLDTIMAENKTLTEQITALNANLLNLSEDDYARTELFKQFRIQHEDVIRRINHLESTNIQLREEAEKYQAERTSYRVQIENESEVIQGELESQLVRVEADLTRIRSARDELLADLSTRKANMEQDRVAVNHWKELAGAKDDRITGLELEVARLRSQVEEQSRQPTSRPEVDSLDLVQLRQRYENLETSFDSINKELPALQGAYKRVQALANKKVMDFSALEEKVSILLAEKSKADQKYFAARKDMDTRIGEVRTLRAQNAKSTEIIAQLKEVETSNRMLLSNLEKQLSELRHVNNSIMTEHKKLETASREANSKVETLKTQVSELTNLLKSKDAANFNTKQRIQTVEGELEQIRVRCEQAQKERDTWKSKSLGSQSSDEEMLRTLALCTICRQQFKNTVLKTCGHVFCKACVDDRISNRMRKCPNCSKAFDKMDVMTVHM